MIVGLHGKKRSGKDTCADHLVECFGFEKIAFADGVRDALYALNPKIHNGERYQDVINQFGYEEAKNIFPDIRVLLQRMGTEVGRNLFGPDIWVDLLQNRIASSSANYVISDVRFENEALMVRRLNGPVFEIVRDTGEIDNHISEQPLPDALVNQHIYNNSSFSDLYNTLDHFIGLYI